MASKGRGRVVRRRDIAPTKVEKRIKLFVYADAPHKPTGFGVVMYNILAGLYRRGLFDIRVAGINYDGLMPHGLPFTIHPMSSRKDDPFGFSVFKQVLSSEKPDIILLFQDMFLLCGVSGQQSLVDLCKEIYPDVPVVCYFPVDGEPIPRSFIEMLGVSDANITISEYGAAALKRYGLDGVHVVRHGVDLSTFKPLSADDRLAAKTGIIGGACSVKDTFLFGSVNRYQPRKNVPQIIYAFSHLLHGCRICPCGHVYGLEEEKCPLNGCPTSDAIAVIDPIDDIAMYLHMEAYHSTMGTTQYDSAVQYVSGAGIPAKKIFLPTQATLGKYTPVDMNRIYNAFDAYLSTTLGEGFGLTAVEAAAAGTRVVIADNTTAREVVPVATYVRNACLYATPRGMGALRPIPSMASLVTAMFSEYWIWRNAGREKSVELGNIDFYGQEFDWPKLSYAMQSILLSVLGSRDKREKKKISAVLV